MADITTSGLRSGALPNVYIENIILQDGTRGRLSMSEIDITQSPHPVRFLGNLKYEKPPATPRGVDAELSDS